MIAEYFLHGMAMWLFQDSKNVLEKGVEKSLKVERLQQDVIFQIRCNYDFVAICIRITHGWAVNIYQDRTWV